MSTRAPFRALPAALAAAFVIAACHETVSGPDPELVALAVHAQAEDGQVALLVVEVSGPGMSNPIIGNFPFEDGVAVGQLTVPVGQRTFEARAYHEQGFVTHQGSTTQVIRPGDSEVAIALTPAVGNVTIVVTIAEGIIIVFPEEAEVVVGEIVQFAATVVRPDGTVDQSPPVVWGSSNTAVAEVDEAGVTTAYFEGEAAVGPSCLESGMSAQAILRVRSPFNDFALEFQDPDGIAGDALGSIAAAAALPDDTNWPLRLTGVVTPSNFEPMAAEWPARIDPVEAGGPGVCGLGLTLAEAVTPSDLLFAPTSFDVAGGRPFAVEVVCEIAAELEQETPTDWIRVAELTEILIGLMGLPIPEP